MIHLQGQLSAGRSVKLSALWHGFFGAIWHPQSGRQAGEQAFIAGVGAGQQQVRFIWASIGMYHACLWKKGRKKPRTAKPGRWPFRRRLTLEAAPHPGARHAVMECPAP